MIFVTPTPTIQTYAIIRALNWQPANIYVNSVSATDTFMTHRGRTLQRGHGQRLDQHRVSEGSGIAGLGERRDDEAVQVAHGEVSRRAANANNGLYFYGFAKAAHVRPGDVQGGEESDPAGLDGCPAVAQRDEPVRPAGRAAEDLEARDHYIISHQQPMRFNNGLWTLFGQLVDGRPRG